MKNELSVEFLNRIKEGKSIKYKDFKNENSKLLYKIEKVFGSITKCAEFCGISKEELINKYGMSHRIYGESLQEDEIKSRLLYLKSIGKLNTNNMRTQFNDLRLEYSLKKKFGSVKKALSHYGLESDTVKVKKDDIIKEINRLYSNGYDLTYKNMYYNNSKLLFNACNKFELSWYKILEQLNIEVTPIHVPKYNKELIQDKLSEILQLEGSISYSILRNKYSGILSYVRSNYESIFDFYVDFGYEPLDYIDLSLQKTKGRLFEKVFKELLEKLNIKFEYNKYINNNRLRPDFILEDGTILDCKLSSWTDSIQSTYEKYIEFTHKVKIVYLRGTDDMCKVNDENFTIVNVRYYLDKLKEEDKDYFIGKLEYILKNDNFIESVTTERTSK